MIRRILIGILITIVLVYGAYFQYRYINKTKILNNLIKEKLSLENKYLEAEVAINNINKQIDDVKSQKDATQNQITAKQAELAQVNKNINDQLAVINNHKETQAKQNIYNGSGNKIAYLTFDDGPSGYTSRVLDILKEYGVKATFFVNGKGDEYSYNLYRRMINEGHTIGNHIYSHNYKTIYSSVEGFDNDFNRLQTLLNNVTGVTPTIMRFPGGSNNTVSNDYYKGIMDILVVRYRNLGYQYFDWNVSAGDSAPSEYVNNNYVINNVINGCSHKSSAIILMHDSQPTTPNTLETIIVSLANTGFNFAPLTSSTPAIHFK